MELVSVNQSQSESAGVGQSWSELVEVDRDSHHSELFGFVRSKSEFGLNRSESVRVDQRQLESVMSLL